MRSFKLILFFILLSIRLDAQTLTGDFASGTSTNPSVSHTITAGRGQFALISVDTNATCDPLSGWVQSNTVSIFGVLRYCSYYILSATGSESTTFTISASSQWVISIWECSVAFQSLAASVATEENADPISTDPISVTAGNLVIASMANETGFVPAIAPSGYTHPTPSGASNPHYGTTGFMMGSVAYRVAPSTTTEDPIWDIDQPVFSGIGVHVFTVSGGSNNRGRNLSLLGVQ